MSSEFHLLKTPDKTSISRGEGSCVGHILTRIPSFFFHSNPSCTDIMEIYNAVEEMDVDDDEVSLSIFCQIAVRFEDQSID